MTLFVLMLFKPNCIYVFPETFFTLLPCQLSVLRFKETGVFKLFKSSKRFFGLAQITLA